jgi:hypothetical protein
MLLQPALMSIREGIEVGEIFRGARFKVAAAPGALNISHD